MLIKHTLTTNNDLSNIKSWFVKNNIDAQVGQVVINPETFEPLVTIVIDDEKELAAFYLRWGR